jgi:predicted metal-dependent hydrolase
MLSTFRRSLFPPRAGHGFEAITVDLDGRMVEIRLKVHARARRFVLKFDAAGAGLSLTMPPGASRAKAVQFAELQADWIRSQFDRAPDPVPFAAGAIVPLRGMDRVIRHVPEMRLHVVSETVTDGVAELHVSGQNAHLARRLTDWLKSEARADLAHQVRRHTAKIEARAKRIRISDQKTRWGSCSTAGTLSFSWRLIMAPAHVLDYVAAHEVAHLVHMDHSDRFWRLLGEFYGDVRPAQSWLKRHGPQLHCFGVLPSRPA